MKVQHPEREEHVLGRPVVARSELSSGRLSARRRPSAGKAREIVAQPAMAEWAGAELYPGTAVQTDAEITEYIRTTHNTVYHPAGTVRMAANDELSPLDPQLRVKGLTGLRVADASVMPELVTVNPNITTMMIGERCADLVKPARAASA